MQRLYGGTSLGFAFTYSDDFVQVASRSREKRDSASSLPEFLHADSRCQSSSRSCINRCQRCSLDDPCRSSSFSRAQPFWVVMSTTTNLAVFFSLVLAISGIVFAVTPIVISNNDIHECSRFCGEKSFAGKLCSYEFIVTESRSVSSGCNATEIKSKPVECKEGLKKTSLLTINGKSPGPSIEICLGDTIEVFLYNKLGTSEISIHWHGIRQEKSVHMDGVPMVTQCPVLPFTGFRYEIRPESAGTYIYYAHSVSQQGDGVYGSLTVRGPRDDPTLERMLLLSSRPSTPLTLHSHSHPPTPSEILVNGQAEHSTLRVDKGFRYLIRLANANAFNCPLSVSLAGHWLQVLTADCNSVQPVDASHVVLFPGERFDVILEANQSPGKYLLGIQGLLECKNLLREITVFYDDLADSMAPIVKSEIYLNENQQTIVEKGYDCRRASESIVCALDLRSANENYMDEAEEEVSTIYVPFDLNHYSTFSEDMTDYSWNLQTQAFYPAYLSISQDNPKILQINKMSFKYPSSPILSQPENTPENLICSLEERSSECESNPMFCECLQIMELPPRRMVEVILINEGLGGNASYTFHLHGYNVSVLGQQGFEHPITKNAIISLIENEGLARNFKDPPRKDSFMVPNKGYIIIRFFTDNIGYWLWEARSTAIAPDKQGPGMQFLMKIGSPEDLPNVPVNFPTCGNSREVDTVFVFD